MNSYFPSDVKDAIHKLSEFADQNGYAEVTVSYTGSASFTQHSNRRKKENFGVIGILAIIVAITLLVSSLIVIGIGFFKPLPEIHDNRWMLILLGSSVLSAMVTIEPTIGKKEMRGTHTVIATCATFILLGLALLSTSLVLSTLFWGMAFSSFVFGQGFDTLQKGIRQTQQFIKPKDKVV
jgi:hypothetical protein